MPHGDGRRFRRHWPRFGRTGRSWPIRYRQARAWLARSPGIGQGLDHTVAERIVGHGGRSRNTRVVADHHGPVGWNHDGNHARAAARPRA